MNMTLATPVRVFSAVLVGAGIGILLAILVMVASCAPESDAEAGDEPGTHCATVHGRERLIRCETADATCYLRKDHAGGISCFPKTQ